MIWQVLTWLPAYPVWSQTRFPYWFDPRSRAQSCSIKQFISSVITQKQPGLVPLRRHFRQRNHWAFIPSQSKASLALSPESSIPATSLCPFTCLATHLPTFCYAKSCQFTAFCLHSHPELNLHLSLHLTNQLRASDVFLISWKGPWKIIKFQLPCCEEGHLS